jgi:hypothetical protein
MNIEANFLTAFGLVAGPPFKSVINNALEKAEITCMFEHQLQTTKSMKSCLVQNVGDCFVFSETSMVRNLSLKREYDPKLTNPGFTQILLPNCQVTHL